MQGRLSFRQIHILFSNFSSIILHSLSRNYNKKSIFFTSISKSVVIYITITVTNIPNNIIKQYYGIIKAFKVLVIFKKKQFSRTNILIQGNSQQSFPHKNHCECYKKLASRSWPVLQTSTYLLFNLYVIIYISCFQVTLLVSSKFFSVSSFKIHWFYERPLQRY